MEGAGDVISPPRSISEGRTPGSTPARTPPDPKRRPHVCSFCKASFGRDEHLQRHVRCHTGERKYQCPCGMTFGRNDVFVRHMRGCAKGLSDSARRLVHRSKSQTKTKRACDECAKTKAKCDGTRPCDRCRRKAIKCEKTRSGYEDPYSMYSIQNPVAVDVAVDASSSGVESSHMDSNPTNTEFDYAAPPLDIASVHFTATVHDQETYFPPGEAPNNMALVLPSDKDFNMSHLFGDYGLVDDEELSSEPDPASIYFSSVGSLDYLFNPQNQHTLISNPGFLPLTQSTRALTDDGFSLARLDPIEAKCSEIIALLKRSDPAASEGTIDPYITRDNMVRACHLYGKHFQHNLPIIHSPSFDILTSPPILLLAVMLVGTCYTEDSIPPAQVPKLAMRLLAVIGAEPASFKFSWQMHETNMQCPSISTIQAGILICCILSCSRNVAALKSVRICSARNISMCERAGLFEPMDSIDYTMLTTETFNWELWIEQETRRRIACEMFCQDMVHCIFLGRSPDLDPTKFNVKLPSYESCWEAQTAAECLHRLQSLPVPMHVSAAINLLTSWPDTETPLFEASGFGMHVLVNGLHCLLHQATQSDMEPSFFTSAAPSAMSDTETIKAFAGLQLDPSGPSIAAIADRTVQERGSPAIRKINNALDSWRTTWDMRNNRDVAREEGTFKGDPLPFWWLAKLYLALHYHAHILRADSEFATPRAEGMDGYAKTAVQRKIVGWLSSFRGQRCAVDFEAESWLPHLMKPSQEKAD